MSKSEILYVKGMNISESEGDDDADEDIWDDRKLNDAYDKALQIANAEVAKRVAMSTNSQQGDNKECFKKKDKVMSRPTSSKGNKKDSNTQWKAGMACRAVYEGDGLEYEAFVLRIINGKECVVRFLGYENSEIVPINTLKPSLGKEEQASQIEQALSDKTDGYTSQSPNLEKMELGSDRVPSPGSTEKSFFRRKKSPKKKKPQQQLNNFDIPEMPFQMPNLNLLRNLGSIDLPIPPPPPMTLPSTDRVDSEEQAVSSMLLSWYMSGYYTGLYQGLKRAKDNRRNV